MFIQEFPREEMHNIIEIMLQPVFLDHNHITFYRKNLHKCIVL